MFWRCNDLCSVGSDGASGGGSGGVVYVVVLCCFRYDPDWLKGNLAAGVRHSSPLEPIELPSSFFFLLSVKQDKPLQVCLPCHSCSGILVNNWLSASSLIRQRACCSPSIFHLVLILSVLCFINHNHPSITDPNQSWILAQNLLIKKLCIWTLHIGQLTQVGHTQNMRKE